MKRIVSALLIASGAFLAACSSAGAPQPGSAPHKAVVLSGTEAISGSDMHPPAKGTAVVPVKVTGVFATNGTITLDRCSLLTHYRCIDKPAINFAGGSLHIDYQKAVSTAHVNTATCAASYTNTAPYTVTGGSGVYAGATGHGVATITFTAIFPKVNGQCDTAGNAGPVKGTGRLQFLAHGPVFLS
ncbi:MAG TPA: hypothetical protein VMK13_07055 [Streptosporangiaceae bacterium]|nr:hypothetical protein [Streptosporangiaceae bacterium]